MFHISRYLKWFLFFLQLFGRASFTLSGRQILVRSNNSMLVGGREQRCYRIPVSVIPYSPDLSLHPCYPALARFLCLQDLYSITFQLFFVSMFSVPDSSFRTDTEACRIKWICLLVILAVDFLLMGFCGVLGLIWYELRFIFLATSVF